MITRLSKIALVAAVGLLMAIIVLNNLTDYKSNYDFVFHVLSMDTTFPGNALMWRSIHSVPVYHAFYASLIIWEAAAAVLLFVGAWKLWQLRGAGAESFNQAKNLVIGGLTLNLLQWLVAFITIGGEWFLMWQSSTWNGQTAAGRMFAIVGIILIFVNTRDEELSSKK
jgi:predicted small integral membrane protein